MPDAVVVRDTPAFRWGNNLVHATLIEVAKLRAAEQRSAAAGRAALAAATIDREHRIRGWLRHVWRKATGTVDDDWSEDGDPHPWWDKSTGPPMTSFQRFDLHEASYPLGMLALRTPAWREVYSTVLHGLCERYTSFWSAVDWNTQFGDDPDRAENYPV